MSTVEGNAQQMSVRVRYSQDAWQGRDALGSFLVTAGGSGRWPGPEPAGTTC